MVNVMMVKMGKVGGWKSVVHHVIRIRSHIGGIIGILRKPGVVIVSRACGRMRSGRRMKRKNRGGILIVLLRAVRMMPDGWRRYCRIPARIRHLIRRRRNESR